MALKTVASGLMVWSLELLFDRTDAMGSDTSIIFDSLVDLGGDVALGEQLALFVLVKPMICDLSLIYKDH